MINLFIDTNIFLSFFHLTSEDLEELKKLIVLMKNDEIRLFLPEQVRNEFTRNRGTKIVDAMRKLQDAKFNLSFPLFAKDYPEYAEVRDLMKKADGLHAKLVEKIRDDAEDGKLSADKIILALFDKAKNIGTDEKLYLEALKRVRLGNPPGKEDSMGDAVNWECLLKEVPNGENIYIVSGDKDFRSQLTEGEPNEFLDKEWSKKKESSLLFYTEISDFLNGIFPISKLQVRLNATFLSKNWPTAARLRIPT
jgi:predicted nucleic acid-binding protein